MVESWAKVKKKGQDYGEKLKLPLSLIKWGLNYVVDLFLAGTTRQLTVNDEGNVEGIIFRYSTKITDAQLLISSPLWTEVYCFIL